MSWDFDPPNDLDSANATGLNTLFERPRDTINDLKTNSLRHGAFNWRHGGKAYRPLWTQYTEAPAPSAGAPHTYPHTTFGPSMRYAGFGLAGGTEATLSYTGDRVIVGHPDHGGAYTSGLAKITFAGAGPLLGMNNGTATGKIAGLAIMGGVQLQDVDPAGDSDIEFMLCFQIQLAGSSTWNTIDRTERFWSIDDKAIALGSDQLFIPCDIACLLVGQDIDDYTTGSQASSTVQAVRMMWSLYKSPLPTTFSGNPEVTLLHWNLMTVGLVAGDV